MTKNILDRVVVVLNEPQNLVNIAGTVRAMRNMGVTRLHLVRPVEFDAWRITGIAHRSDDVLEAARFFDSLEDAVRECILVLGTTARARTAHRNYGFARGWAGKITERACAGPVALVFGREDRGLSNKDLDLCDGVVLVPTDPEYSSLNLAQACLLVLYEVFLAAEAGEPRLPQGKRSTGPASKGELEEMFDALERGLAKIDFFKARRPESVMRTLRTLIARAEPDQQETGLVKAVGFEIVNYLDRIVATTDPGPFTDNR